MEKIIKGHIANIESWVERIVFSKKVSQDTIFTSNYADYKFKLYYWDDEDPDYNDVDIDDLEGDFEDYD